MKVVLRGTRMHYDQHRTLVFTAHMPNWFQRNILFRKMKLINYVGRGSKWFIMNVDGQVQLNELTDKKLIYKLSGWGEGEKFYKRNGH